VETISKYNARIAARLEEVASILRSQNANPFRIGAYMRAAANIRSLPQPLDELIAEQGIAGLDEIPGIGQSLSRLIFQLVKTGPASDARSATRNHRPSRDAGVSSGNWKEAG
jgi:putative hydrolase